MRFFAYSLALFFLRNGGHASGILGKAFSFDEAKELNLKFLNHRNRDSKLFMTCPNERCEIRVYVPEDAQFFRCDLAQHGCGESFCKLCLRKAHPAIKNCNQAKANEKADEALSEMRVQVVAEGGRFCPQCGDLSAAEDSDPYKWKCDHMTCGQCKHEYCRNCGADRAIIEAEDASFHVPMCGLYTTYENAPSDSRKPTDWPAEWKEHDPQFNKKSPSFFRQYPQHRATWKKLGVLKSKKSLTTGEDDGGGSGRIIQGIFRKCQPKCGCAYGDGHCDWVKLKPRK
jgi:hypothetical protein